MVQMRCRRLKLLMNRPHYSRHHPLFQTLSVPAEAARHGRPRELTHWGKLKSEQPPCSPTGWAEWAFMLADGGRAMKDSIGNEYGVPAVVDWDTFQAELDALRVREKAHTREGDAIAAARRRLSMVEVDGATPLIGERGAVTLLDAFEGRRMLLAYYSCGTLAILHRSSARDAPGLHRRFASSPIFIPATSPSPCFAKAPTKRVPATATSWDGRCRGTRPWARSTFSWRDAG